MPEIKFEIAAASDVKEPHQRVQTVDVVTDMTQRCSRCKTVAVGEPLGLSLIDVVGDKERHDAQRAVAIALYDASKVGTQTFDEQSWTIQSYWLREAAADGWSVESFSLDSIGIGLTPKARAAGVEEAKKWAAFSDRRKMFRVCQAKFPPGWLTLAFEARGSKDGVPVSHANVMVHVCPTCAPVVFDAANVDPANPFGDGVKW